MSVILGEQHTEMEYEADGFMYMDATRSARRYGATITQNYLQTYSDGTVGNCIYEDRRLYWTKRGAQRGTARRQRQVARGVASGRLLRVYC